MTTSILPPAAAPASSDVSRQIYARAVRVMPGGNSRTAVFSTPYPVYVRSGQGARVTDVDGNVRLDLLNNSTTLVHGHAHPRIVQAVTDAVAQGSCFGMPTEVEVAFAEALCARNPGFDHARFTSTGTEAVMMAVQAARAHTLRPKIAKCAGSYHGAYDAVAVNNDGAESTIKHSAVGIPQGVSDNTVIIPFNDPDGAVAVLEQHAGELAGVLIDPLPWRNGLRPASAGFLAALRDFCDRSGAVLISDEVGSFRIGPQGAITRLGGTADLFVLGKVIGGGMPIGAVAGRRSVMAVFDPSNGSPRLPHSGSYNANPVSMSAGLASLDLLTPDAFAHLERLGDAAREVMRDAIREAGVDWQVNGMGSVFRVIADQARRTHALSRALLDHGVHLGDSGLGCVSTVMGDDDVEQFAEAFRRSVADTLLGQP